MALSASPAANADLRAEGPYGDWRQVPPEALYDAGDYYFELGYDHLLVLSGAALAEAGGEAGAFGSRTALLVRARELLEQALQRSPADAQAWAALALVSAMAGDDDVRTLALRRSWELAPYNEAMAQLRIMTLAAAPPADPGPETRAAIGRDLEVMRQRRGRNLERLLAAAPDLANLIERLRNEEPAPEAR